MWNFKNSYKKSQQGVNEVDKNVQIKSEEPVLNKSLNT